MKKMIKMSLVAAVAVAGLTSTAAADVKVGGHLAYQLNNSDAKSAHDDKTKVSFNFKGAVNETISYAVSYAERATGGDSLNSGATGTGLSNAKFIVKTDKVTAIVGRQGLDTPWTDASDAIDSTDVGNGVVALMPVGPVTLAAAHVFSHNAGSKLGITGDADINIVAAIGAAGPVNYQLWMADIEDVASSMTAIVGAKAGGADVELRHVATDLDANSNSYGLTALSASVKAGAATVDAGYAMGAEDGIVASLNKSGNAANDVSFGSWMFGVPADGSLMSVGATMPMGDMFKANLNYAIQDGATNTDTEIKAQLSVNVAKNASLYGRVAVVDGDSYADAVTYTRVYMAYKF